MTPQPPIQQIKDSMRQSWIAGDFGMIARTMTGAAEAFVSTITIPPGAHVLDVACGTGNVTLPIARQGARVVGVDIAPNLITQARERAAAEGLTIQFDEGDAEQLAYPDASFDLAVSMFGAMFAPRPAIVASELARVLKPGGQLFMANWNPASFSSQMFQVTARHLAPPPGLAPPVLWGDQSAVRERLAPYFHNVETQLVAVDFNFPTNAAGTVSFFRQYFGPTHIAFSRLDESGQAALTTDLEALWSTANTASDPDKQTLIHNQYLHVAATRT